MISKIYAFHKKKNVYTLNGLKRNDRQELASLHHGHSFVKTECTYFCESTSLQAGSYFLTL